MNYLKTALYIAGSILIVVLASKMVQADKNPKKIEAPKRVAASEEESSQDKQSKIQPDPFETNKDASREELKANLKDFLKAYLEIDSSNIDEDPTQRIAPFATPKMLTNVEPLIGERDPSPKDGIEPIKFYVKITDIQLFYPEKIDSHKTIIITKVSRDFFIDGSLSNETSLLELTLIYDHQQRRWLVDEAIMHPIS